MRRFFGLILLLAVAQAIGANTAMPPSDLASRLRLYEGEGGASCSHFLADILPWQRRLGDWMDARGRLYGDEPFDTASAGPIGASWDVTTAVKKWYAAGQARGVFFLRAIGGSGYAVFYSRENTSPGNWPMLVLEYADGRREMKKPSADTHLNCSTYRSIGRVDPLVVSGQENVLIEFPLPAEPPGRKPIRARLVLSNAKGQPSPLLIGVFEAAIPGFPVHPVRQGFAAKFDTDGGIDKHPDVLFASGFDEGFQWKSRWSTAQGEIDIVKEDTQLRFAPLSGTALRINLKKGSNFGSDLRLNTKSFGREPDELYFRYYVRLANDWNPTLEGGKMPGMAGTYNTAGWGGRRSDGTNGWSMRGGFLRIFEDDHPMRGLTQLVTYAYHADMSDIYGDHWTWPGALLERNRWYCVEQQIALNRPGSADGVIRVWIDGRMVMERTDVRYRRVDHLHIEDVWVNVYHGGVAPSPHDQHLFVDNVVVARRYIGPIGTPEK